MKKLLASMLAFGLIVFASQAVTVTNQDGVVFTVNTLDEAVSALRTASIRPDQSTYASQNQRQGIIVREYDFAIDGGAEGAITLGDPVPNGAVIADGGFVEVHTAVAGCTNSILGIVTTSDLVSTVTTLNATGIKDVLPDDDGTAVTVVADTSYVTLTIDDDAATAGAFTVYLPYIQSNP